MRTRKKTSSLSKMGRYPRPRSRSIFLRRFLFVLPVFIGLFFLSDWFHEPSQVERIKEEQSSPVPSAALPPTAIPQKPRASLPSSAPQAPVALPAPIIQSPNKLSPEVMARLSPLPPATAYPQGPLGAKAKFDKLVIKKKERRLYASTNGTVMRVYPIALGQVPEGHRTTRGDKKTPEGAYSITGKDAASQYSKSLRLSYPNAQDLLRAQELGKPVGSHVYIHGLPPDTAFIGAAHRASDWTNGSIAVTNEEVEEIFQHTPLGTPILIEP